MIVLDRYEGNFAVLEEDGKIKNVPRELLETGISEGTVLEFSDGRYKALTEQTEERRKAISDLQNNLFE